MKTYDELVNLFEQANFCFLNTNQGLLRSQASERTLCGALMLCLHDLIINDDSFSGYYVDVEYNRNMRSITIKTIIDEKGLVLPINCDLILHSRGERPEQDNLIALEMKKATGKKLSKQKDRERLIALTKDTFAAHCNGGGHTLPEHVCRYVLGVYFEINFEKQLVLIEYYKQGQKIWTYNIDTNLIRRIEP